MIFNSTTANAGARGPAVAAVDGTFTYTSDAAGGESDEGGLDDLWKIDSTFFNRTIHYQRGGVAPKAAC